MGIARPLVRRLAGALVATLAATSAMLVGGAHAGAGDTVVEVTTTADVTDADDGEVSLREAVVLASGDGSVTDVVLQAGSTYVLDDCAGDGGGALVVDHPGPLRIAGPATVEQTCDGAWAFELGDGGAAAPGQRRTLEDLVLRSTAAEPTGLVYAEADTALDGVTVTGDFAGQPAVFAIEGSLSLVDTTLTGLDAPADDGAAGLLAAFGGLVAYHSEVVGNRTGGSGVLAAGADGTAPALEARDLRIEDNELGGDLALVQGGLYLQRAQVRDNEAALGVLASADPDASGGRRLLWVGSSVLSGNVLTTAPTAECCPILGFVGGADAFVDHTSVVANEGTRAAVATDDAGGPAPELWVAHSTVAANAGLASIEAAGEAHVGYSTVVAGPGVRTAEVRAAELSMAASIVVGSGPACEVPQTTSEGANVVSDATCGEPQGDDAVGVADPGLGPLDPDSPSPALVPRPGSPAIDRVVGPAFCEGGAGLTDQLGNLIPSGPACDSGAVELRQFADVPADHPFYEDITWLALEGIAGGYAGGGFHPAAAVSRQAMAAFLFRAAGEPAFDPPAEATFSDVSAEHPFFAEVEWSAAEGIAGGYPDGGFHPAAPVSRQAMAAFLHRAEHLP